MLGPSCSLEGGASPFTHGEYILVRIPQEIKVDGCVDNEATVCGTDLPPTSNGTSPQHFAFIRQMYLKPDDSWIPEVYPVVSFTRSDEGYRQPTDAGKAALLPLPNVSLRHPTPASFGTPLHFGRGWSTFRDSFLLVIPIRFEMSRQRPFKRMIPLVMTGLDLARIDRYREYTLLCNIQTRIHGDGAEPNKYSVNSESPHSVLVLEGVDEDAEDADATMRDELILMARCSPIWEEELRRYLEREEMERK